MATVHVVGAGLSGLSCALRVALAGHTVAVYEAAGHAGGRCRSFMDETLGCVIDNGNHMLLGANHATRAYLSDIGSEDRITEIAPAAFPFLDLASGEKWRLRPSGGLLPTWLLSSGRRVPGTTLRDYLSAARLARAGADDTVTECVGKDGPLYDRLWQPLSRAALNTDADEASAQLLWSVVSATLMKGEAACRPFFFHRGLSAALIDPAVVTLKGMGADVRLQARLKGLSWQNYLVNGLYFPEGLLRVQRGDFVVLAVPPEICRELWPDVMAPTETRAIVNAHFRLDETVKLPWDMPFLGLVGSETQWIFVRDNVLSVTISAADRHVERPSWELANMIWSEVAKALGRNVGRPPPWRIIKEKRATIAQTPEQVRRRPSPDTALQNMFIAGDWTDTGLPATIEGSIKSGFEAAQRVLESHARFEAKQAAG